MIRISKKGDYAVFLMAYLAQRGSHPEGRVGANGATALCSAHEISEATSLQRAIVANLLKELTRAGLLESVRGIRGGYRLARRPEEITLAQILTVVDGPFHLVDCTQHAPDGSGDGLCRLETFCPSRSPMRVLHERITKLMDEIRLPELSGARVFPHQPASH